VDSGGTPYGDVLLVLPIVPKHGIAFRRARNKTLQGRIRQVQGDQCVPSIMTYSSKSEK
jgi:hypothetical protein